MDDSPFIDEIREEGERIRARKSILQVLQLRFGDEARTEFETAVNRLENLEQMDELYRIAILSRRLSQIRKAFPKS